MKLTTVLSAVNANMAYYQFIPKQIKFWAFFQIRFVAVFVGSALPEELLEYADHIVLWSKNLDLNTAYVAQNLRVFYPALLELPDDEMVMITDMDMLPMKADYWTSGMDVFEKDDFIYYRYLEGNQIFMCYNAAHPHTWAKAFGVASAEDVERQIQSNYPSHYSGVPGSSGWSTDQEVMYGHLMAYPRLKILQRPVRRLHPGDYQIGTTQVREFDDAHFHRNYLVNVALILDAEKQLSLCSAKGADCRLLPEPQQFSAKGADCRLLPEPQQFSAKKSP